MYLICCFILCAVIWIWFPENISNIPLGQLTLNEIGKYILKIIIFVYAIWMFGNSLKNDKIWPWRWTRTYLPLLLFKIIATLVIGYVVIWLFTHLLDTDKNTYIAIGFLVVGVIVAFINLIILSETEFYAFFRSIVANRVDL